MSKFTKKIIGLGLLVAGLLAVGFYFANANGVNGNGVSGLQVVTHDSSLFGTGTFFQPLGVVGGGGGTVSSIATSAPITGGTITTTGTIGITQASTSTNGYLSSTNWNTFNNKQPAGSYLVTTNNLSDVANSNTSLNNILPSQVGNNGLFLQTDGTDSSWQTSTAGLTATYVGVGNGSNLLDGTSDLTFTVGTFSDQFPTLIDSAIFTGVGLDDITSTGTYNSPQALATYVITIDGNGAPDTFSWAKNGITIITGAALQVGTNIIGPDGANFSAVSDTGHTIGDSWSITAHNNAIINTTGSFASNGGSILSSDANGNLYLGLNGGGSIVGNSNMLLGNSTGNALTTGFRNTIIGTGAGTGLSIGSFNTFLGRQTGVLNGNDQDGIAIGNGSITTSSTLVAGSTSHAITDVYFGNGITNASPTSYRIRGTGGLGTDIDGGFVIHQAGISTGAGLSGDQVWQYAPSTVSSATPNSPTEAMRLKGTTGFLGIGTTAPTANLHIAGKFRFVNGNEGTAKVLTSNAVGDADWLTPSVGNLTGAVTSTGLATSLGSFSSANLLSALTTSTGTGVAVFDTAPSFSTSISIGTNGTTGGSIKISGLTSGSTTILVPNVAGSMTMTLPAVAGATNQSLLTTGVTGLTSWGNPPGTFIGQTLLTSGTTFTTSSSTKQIMVWLQAGGGGGGGVATAAASDAAASGGGSGGWAYKLFTVAPSTGYSYTIGTAGSGGAAGNNNGGAGGSSTFTVGGTTVTANGGAGGKGAPAVVVVSAIVGAAAGAVSTNGDINGAGSAGGPGLTLAIGTADLSGSGGNSMFGGAGGSSLGNSGTGNAGTGYGAGGGGGIQINNNGTKAGGAGIQGAIFIQEFN